jgi:hypothetical protein
MYNFLAAAAEWSRKYGSGGRGGFVPELPWPTQSNIDTLLYSTKGIFWPTANWHRYFL